MIDGLERVELNRNDPFFAFLAIDVRALWVTPNHERREYLNWDEWREFFKRAVLRGIVTIDELVEADLEGDVAHPKMWYSLVEQYRRVKAAKDAGFSPWQYHENIKAAAAAARDRTAPADRPAPGTRTADETIDDDLIDAGNAAGLFEDPS
jgi:hypothetical protein